MLKKKEAERIDRENQKIMNRIINVKPQMVKTSKLNEDYHKNHLKKKRMLLGNQGIFIEDMIDQKRRFREGSVNA